MPRSLLMYGSNTGNTQFAAQTIANTFANNHSSMPLLNVAEAKPEDILGRDLLILGSPTWDTIVNGRSKEGQLQDQMATFLAQASHFNLAKTPMAVFGLGDSHYQYFCGAAVQLQKFVAQVGGHLVAEPLLIDGLPQFQEEMLIEWAKQVQQSWQELRLLQRAL